MEISDLLGRDDDDDGAGLIANGNDDGDVDDDEDFILSGTFQLRLRSGGCLAYCIVRGRCLLSSSKEGEGKSDDGVHCRR